MLKFCCDIFGRLLKEYSRIIQAQSSEHTHPFQDISIPTCDNTADHHFATEKCFVFFPRVGIRNGTCFVLIGRSCHYILINYSLKTKLSLLVCISKYQGFFPLSISFLRFKRSRNNIEPTCHHWVVLNKGGFIHTMAVLSWREIDKFSTVITADHIFLRNTCVTWINYFYTRGCTQSLIRFMFHFFAILGQALSTS